jgi:nitrile hydratase
MTNTIHDMGGMQGFGPVVREEDEPVFHEPWEGRLWGMRQAVIRSGKLKLRPGENRGIIETMGALAYLTTPYYERFLHSTIDRIVAHGLLTQEEIDERTAAFVADAGTAMPTSFDRAAAEAARASLYVAPYPRPASGEPVLQAGQAVRARNLNWDGHNRLPRYVRGRLGIVERVNGWYVIEDDHAERLGRNPQPVYTVRFDGTEIWGPDSEPNLRVYVELWEGYLEAARADHDEAETEAS